MDQELMLHALGELPRSRRTLLHMRWADAACTFTRWLHFLDEMTSWPPSWKLTSHQKSNSVNLCVFTWRSRDSLKRLQFSSTDIVWSSTLVLWQGLRLRPTYVSHSLGLRLWSSLFANNVNRVFFAQSQIQSVTYFECYLLLLLLQYSDIRSAFYFVLNWIFFNFEVLASLLPSCHQ